LSKGLGVEHLQKPLPASSVLWFCDAMSICDLASKNKVQRKLGKRYWLNQQIEYSLFPLLKSRQGTVEDFWSCMRRIFGRRKKNVNSILLVSMRPMMLQKQES